MKEWFWKEGITVEEAFRVIDHDFDGYIKKNDIEHFIINVLQTPEKEISNSKI